ncbi:unnamed protein product [Haemonchus placei]|uniref:glucuronosyltransferase n=1 Tax=Haemonchus placei TaxID=6290 RepID=A0A0N4WQ84_HAEPC|nr:unnamed protein product [Haemonchus placei]
MIRYCIISLVLSLHSIDAYKFLVYSPIFGYSHTNFMGVIADILTEAGHDVTVLMPLMDMDEVNRTGVKLTTKIIRTPQDPRVEEWMKYKSSWLSHMWTMQPSVFALMQMARNMTVAFAAQCEALITDDALMKKLADEKFDVGIAEAFSICGLGIIEALKIPSSIATFSGVHMDIVSKSIGEPIVPSYVPGHMAIKGDRMNLIDRLMNIADMVLGQKFFGDIFIEEIKVLRANSWPPSPDWIQNWGSGETLAYVSRGLPSCHPVSWRGLDMEKGYPQEHNCENDHLVIPRKDKKELFFQELLADASYVFTNSNPYLDYPRPMLHKTVPLGGITVHIDPMKNVLPKKWDDILNERNTTVFVSFGSVAKSMYMPDEYKKNLLKVFESMPETTFIWKYEEEGSKLGAHLKNVHLSTWAPQNALLADPRLTVFITHGGLGSTTELAHLGKPAILMPIFADQTRNANMLAKHGGGIVLTKFALENPQIIKDALKKIFNDKSFSQNAKRLSEMLRNQPINTEELLIRYSEFAAKFGRLPNLDPYGRHLSFIEYFLIDIFLVVSSIIVLVAFIAFKIFLIYSPLYGYSHTNFMGAIADTLTEAGHDVQLADEKFDVGVAEAVGICGLGIFEVLKTPSSIVTCSNVHIDIVSRSIGEPLVPSYVPGNQEHMKDKDAEYLQTETSTFLTTTLKIYKKLWSFLQEILADASFVFTNSNPYLDYPRPMLHKTIPLGGVAVRVDPKKNVLSKDWDSILNERNTTVFVSFGSVAKSIYMPDEYRKNLLKVFESMPETTFIWKYEEEGSKLAAHLKNVHLTTWAPQNALLGKLYFLPTHFLLPSIKALSSNSPSDDNEISADPRLTVFITHGGLGSSTELAHLGKPAIIMPVFADQVRNANMLGKHGGCIVLTKLALEDPQILKDALKKIFTDASFSKNAKRLSEMLLNQPISAKQLLISHSEFAARYGRLPNLDPYGRHLSFVEYFLIDIFVVVTSTVVLVVFIAFSVVRRCFAGKSKSKKE